MSENSMYQKLTVDLPRGWKVILDKITDRPPFDENGERDYDVSEDLFQAQLNQAEGKPLIVDIGFYQTKYQVCLVLADKWEEPLEVVSCDTAIDAAAIAKKLAGERT